MTYRDPHIFEKQRDCQLIYLKHDGGRHGQIELEMRQLGWHNFHRRVLYARRQRGSFREGWIKALGWDKMLEERFETTATQPEFENFVPIELADAEKPEQPQPVEIPEPAPIPDVSAFHTWLKKVTPGYDWDAPHIRYLCHRLEAVTRGENKRLMINMPPRHGKSELATVRYPAFRLREDPALNVIIGSYGQNLANRFSRKIRRVLQDDLTHRIAERRSAREASQAEPFAAVDVGLTSGPALPYSASVTHSTSAATVTTGCIAGITDPERPIRDVVEDAEADPFPFTRLRPKNSEAEWETSKGGGLRAAGVGAGVTGFGADLIIIDDPIKSRADAESQTQRDNVWDWFTDDIYSRLEPNGSIILIQTRWHEDDLAGRLLNQSEEEGTEKWEVINLPAIAMAEPPDWTANVPAASGAGSDPIPQDAGSQPVHAGGTGVASGTLAVQSIGSVRSVEYDLPVTAIEPSPERIPDNGGGAAYAGDLTQDEFEIYGMAVTQRPEGEALWPGRYPVRRLEQIRRQMGTYAFESLFQQVPVAADGGLFKREWFRSLIGAAPPGLNWVRAYDLGVTATANSDYTASFRVAIDKQGVMYIDGGYRARVEYPAQRRYILARVTAERDTEHCVEATHNGTALVQDLKRNHPADTRRLRAVLVREAKTARALRWVAMAEAGNVKLIRGGWNEEFVDEACSFPSGTHDDQIDAVSLAVKVIEQRRRSFHRF